MSASDRLRSSGIEALKFWGGRLLVILGALAWLILMGSSWAEAVEKEPGEFQFNWLDPDKKIYVLQNRKYLKTNRLLFSVLGGTGLSDAYRNVLNADGRVSFYFSEGWGLEFFYRRSYHSENTTYKALVSTNTNIFPIIREIDAEYGGTLHWVPWYAKINVFNSILYFDWYFAGGAGTLESVAIQPQGVGASSQVITPQNLFAIFAGTGHQYHVTQSFTIRLDLTGTYYRAPIFGTSGDQTWFSNYNFGIGFGLRI